MGSTQSSTPEILIENKLAPGDSDLHASVKMEHYGALGMTVALGVLLAIAAGVLFWWLRRRCCRRNRRRQAVHLAEQGAAVVPVQPPAPVQPIVVPPPTPAQPIIQPVIVQPREERVQYNVRGYNNPVPGIPDWDENYVPARYIPRSPSAPDLSVNALALQKAYTFYKNNPQIKPPAAFLKHCPNFTTRTNPVSPGSSNWQAITPEALATAISSLNSSENSAAVVPQPPPAPAPSVAWEGMINHM